ncbi:M24 family metallopeptidase [Amycolatopsis alkalitolerans]|uniref:Aminopeptidase P family protein n=1 Tax=Amycolatopsis alkalitolerans TaxID=2547244 RepID=A0A5C4LSG9_9PSEU|nr:Xaa-Pro peptidase family protein [Amycolatopsis alkalitolerans]TNC21516.1 aminopeptidase P family protein [Amycolatopsis alkalitolerans]
MTAEPLTTPRSRTEYEVRLAALRARMAEQDLTAVALASPENVYYLTGLDHLGYFAFTLLLVPAEGAPIVVTREMERPTVRAQIPGCRHRTFADGSDPADAVAAVLAEEVPPGRSIAIEDAAMFFPPSISKRVRVRLPNRIWRDGTTLLSSARAVKSTAEIDLVKRAAAVSDAAMSVAISTAGHGVSEAELAATIHYTMYRAGGHQPGFAPLIRPLSMLDQEHVTWGDRVLEAGTGIFVELSGCVRRYHAPLSRTVYIGHAPAGAEEAHQAALAGLEAARQALRPRARTGQVYAAWQHAVTATTAGVWPSRHHCGYLVGIGFPPSWVGGGEVLGIRAGGDVLIEAGMTFHLMSWVTGHVVSDTALVTPTGARLLTTTSRELTVVG